MNLGIPYMGSKRKYAHEIMRYIVRESPDARFFYDLFGGGGAMALKALEVPQFERVVYNEIDTSICNLLLHIQQSGITTDFYEWVSRERFFELLKGDSHLSGMAKVCYSFGNDKKSYAYSRDIEPFKKAYHLCAVNKEDTTPFLSEFSGVKVTMPKGDTVHGRRLELRRQFGKAEMESLESLQRLQSLQSLQSFERLEITNKSYEDVEIKTVVSETIIYLDPPYKNTKKYEHDICHDKLKAFIHDSPYKIYVSGYENVYGLKEVLSINTRSTMSATNNSKKVTEKLFCNQ